VKLARKILLVPDGNGLMDSVMRSLGMYQVVKELKSVFLMAVIG
jgi:hypothetical protein